MSSNLTGRQIDRYLFQEEVGRGGMAQVFKATAFYVPARTVAIKVLTDQYKASEEVRARLHQEAQIQCRLHHPNIAHVLGVIDTEGLFALVMEWIEGQDLRSYMRQRTQHGLSLEEIQRFFLPVLDALELVHQHNIVHRDIKPANIMLQEQGKQLIPKLLDFGIAKMLESNHIKTKEGSLLGTIAYVSPEQILGLPPSPSMDIYSLGISLYELITGRPPFRGAYTDILIAHTETMPEDIRNFRTDLPDGLNDVILQALAKEPAQRFPSCAAFRQALEDTFDQTFRLDPQTPSTASLDMSAVLQALQQTKTPPSKTPSADMFPHLAALLSPTPLAISADPLASTQEETSQTTTDPMPSTEQLSPHLMGSLELELPLDDSSPSIHGYIPQPRLPETAEIYHHSPIALSNSATVPIPVELSSASRPSEHGQSDAGLKKGLVIGLVIGILSMVVILGLLSLLR